MRTNNVLMAIATLAIAGCSQNEITEQSPDTNAPIGFGVYTGVQTKGTETTTNTLQADNVGFGVVALNTAKNAVYMTERNVIHNTGSWAYSNLAYWPADGTALNFYSFAPYTGSGITKTSFETITPKIDFSVNTNMTNMVDLVAAEATASSGTVGLEFKHILTRVAFTASTEVTSTTITVTGLEFPVVTGGEFYSSGTYDFINKTWGSLTPITDAFTVSDIGQELNSTAQSLLGGDTDYLFCIPANNSTGATANKIELNIKYTMSSNGVNSNGTKTVFIPAGHFKMGVAYKYNFAIGLNAISFTVTSIESNWNEEPDNL